MKNLWLIALMLLLLNVPLSAQNQSAQAIESPQDSGNAFVRLCSAVEKTAHFSDEEFGNLADCIGYVHGFMEGVDYEALYATAKGKEVAPKVFCIPAEVENGQLIRVVLKYIRDNPAEAHQITAILIAKALGKAYPCPSK